LRNEANKPIVFIRAALEYRIKLRGRFPDGA